MTEIAIVGGGIAGLTAALSLHAAGFRPTVYESVENPTPLGVGINLLPHAVRELTELGLQQRLLEIGVPIDELVYLMADGREVWREPRGLQAGYRWPQIAIHRGQLQMLLLETVAERLGRGALRLGWRLADLAPGAARTDLTFVDRQGALRDTISADLVLGADGIHSVVRRFFYPAEGLPLWNGVTLWRSTTWLPAAPRGRSMIWAGRSSQKFVAYPISEREDGAVLLNWICDLKEGETRSAPPEDWNRKAEPDRFVGPFRQWRWHGIDVPEIVAASGEIYEFPMVDRDPLPQWTFGGITLIGDAAHPMYPIGSNGATQAIIDGRAIAYYLAQSRDVSEALRCYEQDRRPATSALVLANRQQGPDQVLDLAAERAPGPEASLAEALPLAERAEIASRYKRIAGFDPDQLNARMSYTVVPS